MPAIAAGDALTRQPSKPSPSMSETPFKRWQCATCDFHYDEALGLPADGIPPGTRWEDVPDTWTCPDCSAPKSDFFMVETS